MVKNDTRFAALALTLKHDGLKLIVMYRLCPLPYSISNGAISTIPTVHWTSFALATAIASPKLLLHVFVGAQLARLGEGKMDLKTKLISWFSIFIGLSAGVLTGWFMYQKTKARAAQLEEEERLHAENSSEDQLRADYADDPAALEAAEHLREHDDDISLRDAYLDDMEDAYYHDESDDDDASELRDNVFNLGDGDTDDDSHRRTR